MLNTFAVIAGFIAGCVVNYGLVTIGPDVIANPAGVDMSDVDNLQENIKLLKPANFVFPFLAHSLGTLAGAVVAARIAVTHPMKCAIGIGGLFLACGIAMVVMVGGPLWFISLDLLGAYIPMAILGGRLARREVSPISIA
ncbi:MAG: hypothetical protein L7W43_03295 [Rubripirellula sp.]|nr:hypothetical protein [Rubripirellula sp.]